jgi:hypothetical protein
MRSAVWKWVSRKVIIHINLKTNDMGATAVRITPEIAYNGMKVCTKDPLVMGEIVETYATSIVVRWKNSGTRVGMPYVDNLFLWEDTPSDELDTHPYDIKKWPIFKVGDTLLLTNPNADQDINRFGLVRGDLYEVSATDGGGKYVRLKGIGTETPFRSIAFELSFRPIVPITPTNAAVEHHRQQLKEMAENSLDRDTPSYSKKISPTEDAAMVWGKKKEPIVNNKTSNTHVHKFKRRPGATVTTVRRTNGYSVKVQRKTPKIKGISGR